MNKTFKTLIPLIFVALIVFLVGVPYVDNSEIEELTLLLKSNKTKESVLTKFKSNEFTKLPLVVKKYLNKTILDKTKNPKISYITLNGKYKPSQKSKWLDIELKFYYSTIIPTFIEIDRISKPFYTWDKVTNIYSQKTASTKTKFISSIKTNDFYGNKLNRSFLIKYIMLGFASPTTLLPSTNIQWSSIDKYSAKIVFWDNNHKGSAVFYFNKNYNLVKIVSNRYKPGKIDYTKEQFTIHLANYKNVGAYYIPTYIEYQWNLASGDFTSGKYQISNITYE